MTFSNPPSFLPPVLATGQGQSANGRQQLGSGLVTHRGIIDANSFRAQGILYPQSGKGAELIFNQANNIGTLQCYDRDAAQFLDLNLSARTITLNGTKVVLPAGSAQQLLGTYRNVISFSIPAAGGWYESPVQVNATTTGGMVRLEACGSLTHAAVSGIIYVGFMTDGAITADSVTAVSAALANQVMPFSIVYYATPSAALHRFSIMLYTNTGGSSGFWSGAYQQIFVTEQKA